MNSAPDHQQPTPTVRDTGDPPPGMPASGLPSDLRLENIQKYLAPLEKLGNQKVAWIGSILLFFGVFLPIKAASIPFVNLTVRASFWDLTKLESFILILLALASASLAYIRDYRWLWVTGITASLFLVIEFLDSLTGSYLHPSWGWLVLFPGVALILAAAAMKRDPREPSGDAATVVRDLVNRMGEKR